MLNAEKCLPLWILIDEEVNDALLHVAYVLLQHVISDKFDVPVLVTLKKFSDQVGSFRRAYKNAFKGLIAQQGLQLDRECGA